MYRRDLRVLSVLALVALFGFTALSAAAGPPRAPRRRAGGLMVAFRPDVPVGRRLEVLRRHRLAAVASPGPHIARVEVAPEAPDDAQARWAELSALASLRRDPAVRVAEPDYRVQAAGVPADPRFGELWGLHNAGQAGGTADADIDAPEAWDRTAGGDVIVAVIDTGVDYNHPDLSANILRDAKGQVVGWDFANGDPDPMDDNEHGTHVAGILGAVEGNGIGVVGVCPRVKIMPLKFLDGRGSGLTSDAIECIDFAIAHGAKVLNNSWGGGGASQLLEEAIDRARAAGVLFVAAAGNEMNDNDASPSYPASYNRELDNVLSVAASDRNDRLASFSNYGARTVDLAAPGASILSTTPNGGYRSFDGTSMATPMVSGTAALICSRYPELTLSQLRARLLANTDRPAALSGSVLHGRLNADRALVDDATAPGAPSGFTATHRSATALRLTWKASGDDGGSGTANEYELRYDTAPITEATFAGAAALPASELPQPAPAGAAQSLLLSGLQPGVDYYVALRALDRVGNISPLVTLGPVATLASAPTVSPFADEVEGAPQFSGTSPWAVTKESSFSPTHSYTDSPGANYRNGTNAALTQNASVSLSGFAPSLTFRARTALEPAYDFLYVEVSAGGATWVRESPSLTGAAPWSSYRVSLARYYGQSVRVRFRIVTDSQVVDDGVWLDSIRITGDQLQPLGGSVPAAPSNLRAAVSGARVALSWTDNSTDETGFAVERRTPSTSFAPLATLEAGSTGYADSLVQPGVTYTYRVRATGTADDSPYSNEASATPAVLPPPAPTGLTAAAGDRQVRLSWGAASGAKGYRVKRSLTSGSGYITLASTGGTAYTDTGVTNGTTYYYVVTAVNDAGESGNSNQVSAKPQRDPAAALAAPTGLKAEAGRKKVVLRWTQSTSPGVTRNRIYRSRTAGGPYSLLATVSARTSYTNTSVSRNRTYYYVVTAVNSKGQASPRSNEASVAFGKTWPAGR